jgi:hypothetical protein
MELGSNGIQNKGSGGAPPTPPSGVLFKTIEPSQYTSYRTGDEGWRVQNNWFDYTSPTNPEVVAELDYTSPSFFNVLKSPLVVGGVSSTTRFVDVNGIQAFSATGNANLVVIDKLTGMMYSRTSFSTSNWDTAIDSALSYSITVNSIVYDDWFLVSTKEIENLAHLYTSVNVQNDTLTNVLLWIVNSQSWTSSFSTFFPNSRLFFDTLTRYSQSSVITNLASRLYICNARNLITAP